jgi:hypothetical protein
MTPGHRTALKVIGAIVFLVLTRWHLKVGFEVGLHKLLPAGPKIGLVQAAPTEVLIRAGLFSVLFITAWWLLLGILVYSFVQGLRFPRLRFRRSLATMALFAYVTSASTGLAQAILGERFPKASGLTLVLGSALLVTCLLLCLVGIGLRALTKWLRRPSSRLPGNSDPS